MNILGIEKSSFIDYPNKISTVIFTGGCNFSCPFCHNGHLLKSGATPIGEEEVQNFLKKRKKFVDAVCITGGEPTLQKDLKDFIRELKKDEFLVKLDSNGTNPYVLKGLIEEGLVDYIAMDVKAPLAKYHSVVGNMVDGEDIRESIHLIQNSGIDYEFRTTVCQELLMVEDILQLAESIKGSKRYFLQNFRDGEQVFGGVNKYTPYDKEVMEKIKDQIKDWFEVFKIR
ncbi:anaerobic ribonucleoside-triphosphate reductase activating protein [Alkaliphilus hydrothermalis]|uniref:Pyruvate formate lyase activating enzyme n=1 Tax=Alkaliphilus hydrothermalis TaxID=1482730 RepID=A0ABS2NSX9_9FIRM|nr:anaerobic ribonucleoside-triphosphate reductase activating protein [Alkaliphilus hydrothermalis]MBM7616057.1 pyruvate formate lyase activating enzyme [Alkaliphilus hydrothermalis]